MTPRAFLFTRVARDAFFVTSLAATAALARAVATARVAAGLRRPREALLQAIEQRCFLAHESPHSLPQGEQHSQAVVGLQGRTASRSRTASTACTAMGSFRTALRSSAPS